MTRKQTSRVQAVDVRVSKEKIIFRYKELEIELVPSVAVNGSLVTCSNLRQATESTILADVNGTVTKIFLERLKPNILIQRIEVEGGYTKDGIIADLKINIKGAKRALVFHFTHDVICKDEPCDYPRFKSIDKQAYCPWVYPVHLSEFDILPQYIKISKIMLKSKDSYALVLPLSDGARGYITRIGNSMHVILDRMCEGTWNSIHLVVIGFDDNPYALIENTFESAAISLGKRSLLRRYKKYPVIFEYLGWCSWNAFWREINEERMLNALEEFRKRGVPVRFFLIDDGWMSEEKGMLMSFEADKDKFPHGLKQLVHELKRSSIKYVGLWHTLNGYWRGVHPNSELAKMFKESLMKAKDESLVPLPEKALDFFMKWYEFLAECGFDFVKVDNQSFTARTYSGLVNIEHASRELHIAVEIAAHTHSLEVLNCMGQQPETYFNWYASSVARNSIDYAVPHRKSRDKLHLYFNAYNALWMSTLVWPDWDMFQSHDPWGLQQAVARAISGGPVYITDEPDKVVLDIVKRLALSSGVLPRPSIPALPTEDCLMRDPYNEPIPLKLFTKVMIPPLGEYGLIAAFNITKDDVKLNAVVSPSDAKLSNGNYLLYEYFSGKYQIVAFNEAISFELKPMDVKLFVIAPMKHWFVPLGLHDVFIMPMAIDKVILASNETITLLKDTGIFVGYTLEDVLIEGIGGFKKGLIKVEYTKPTIRARLMK